MFYLFYFVNYDIVCVYIDSSDDVAVKYDGSFSEHTHKKKSFYNCTEEVTNKDCDGTCSDNSLKYNGFICSPISL